jgi:hypothetical protein
MVDAPPLDLERIVRAVIKIDDKRKADKAVWAKEDHRLEAQQDALEAVLLQALNTAKIDSMNVKGLGYFYRKVDTKPQATDWPIFYAWIKENDAFEALNKRITKTFIETFMDEHGGSPPPGVAVQQEYKVHVVRKA